MSLDLQQLADGLSRVAAPEEPETVAVMGASAAEAVAVPAPGRCLLTDYAAKGYHLDLTVSPGQLLPAVKMLDGNGFGLDAITGVDWIAQQAMEVVYDFFHPAGGLRVVIRTQVPRDNPSVPTVSAIFPGANWHERETHDFFGIVFEGHPNLVPILLPEDATFHPLRKDFGPS